jgi:hypothetical protein
MADFASGRGSLTSPLAIERVFAADGYPGSLPRSLSLPLPSGVIRGDGLGWA